MNFDLTEEQRLLKDSVERFMSDHYDLDKRKAGLRTSDGFSRSNWQQMAELGFLALPFDEKNGGLGGTAVEQMILLEAFGAGLLSEPYLASVVMAGKLMEQLGTDAQKAHWLTPIMSAEKILTLAHAERDARFCLSSVSTQAKKTASGYSITGHKTLVLAGNVADAAIVLARTTGAKRDTHGLGFFIVPLSASGVHLRSYRTVDGHIACELTCQDVAVSEDMALGDAQGGFPALEILSADVALAVCSDALGAMTQLFNLTLDYIKTRSQFGTPLGSFQVIQHRMADCYILLEQARSMTIKAALAKTQAAPDYLRTVYGVRAFVAEAALKIGHEAIQFHGGMGMTDELAISHYHKRLLFTQTLFGDGAAFLSRYNQLAA
jgi:alkylation response protein AidB-like acyl-CoA dehydrogenase